MTLDVDVHARLFRKVDSLNICFAKSASRCSHVGVQIVGAVHACVVQLQSFRSKPRSRVIEATRALPSKRLGSDTILRTYIHSQADFSIYLSLKTKGHVKFETATSD
jgi:hypothetical protein